MSEKLCRLCFVEKPKRISIFGEKRAQQKIVEIIREHFLDEVTENDHLPKSICRDCWNKLDSFHRFYETVNEAKHKFLANFVKVEAMNFVEIDCDGIESDRKAPLVKDEVIDFGQTEIRSPSLKNKAVCSGQLEQLGNNSKHSSDANTIPNHIIDTQPASYRCDENLDEEVTMNVPCVESVEETAASAIDTSIAAAKSMVEENKTNDHLIANYIDMNCDLCKMPFNSLSDAISHYRNNHNKYTALLRCCQRRIQTSYIRDHVRYHLNPDIFKCEKCHKRFTESRQLKEHMRIHQPRPFQCDICKKRFTTRSITRTHILSSHGQNRQRFQCDKCTKRFDSKNRLKSHVAVVHEQQDQNVCHICAAQYRSKQSLHLHLKEHSGEPRSSCQICGRSYKNEQYLRKHIRTVHEKIAQVPMQCPHCPKISPNRNALAKHIRFIHNFTIHKCPLCDKEFKRPVGLKEHMATHTGEDLYTCGYCPRKFKCQSNIYKHYKLSHPDQRNADRKTLTATS